MTIRQFSRWRQTSHVLRLIRMCFILMLISSVGVPGPEPWANPTGAVVVQGDVSMIDQASQLQITASDGAIINWQAFSIQSGESTRFIQPGSNARVLNRVIGNGVSGINGALRSNGQVYLINPNGVVFGAGSAVNVAGLIASTLGLSDSDFLAGNHTFSGSSGDITNSGIIRASGSVVLIAQNVENRGLISAETGDLILAAGGSVVLTSLEIDNVSFEVTAPAGETVNLGSLLTSDGAIGLFGRSLDIGGIVRAGSITRDSAGRIRLEATESADPHGILIGDNGVTVTVAGSTMGGGAGSGSSSSSSGSSSSGGSGSSSSGGSGSSGSGSSSSSGSDSSSSSGSGSSGAGGSDSGGSGAGGAGSSGSQPTPGGEAPGAPRSSGVVDESPPSTIATIESSDSEVVPPEATQSHTVIAREVAVLVSTATIDQAPVDEDAASRRMRKIGQSTVPMDVIPDPLQCQ